MKKILLLLLGVFACLACLARGVHAGPWVTEARTDRVTILWTSDKPGMAYVELADGTKIWETFAGRRVFHRLHRIRIDGLHGSRKRIDFGIGFRNSSVFCRFGKAHASQIHGR